MCHPNVDTELTAASNWLEYSFKDCSCLIYEIPIDSDEDLIAKLPVAAANVPETYGIFGKVLQSLARCCQGSMDVDVGACEYLL